MGVKHKSVKEALDYVARHPVPAEQPIQMPVWELVARQLFDAAHIVGGTPKQLKRTSQAQKILLDRMVGRRRPGTHPAQVKADVLKVADFTKEIT